MSSLTNNEKIYFEQIFAMQSGYVLNFSDNTFCEFFQTHGILIHDEKYQNSGSSKANKLRFFWKIEPDDLVGKVTSELLERYELLTEKPDTARLEKARNIVARLLGKQHTSRSVIQHDLDSLLINKLPIDHNLMPIIESRIEEITKTFNVGAYLSTILLCGSVLEAVLLGAANKNTQTFNKAIATPKHKDGKVKIFRDWTLSELINVAHEVGVVKLDIKNFSHNLRDFRNYIHPYEQLISRFAPRKNTAEICLRILTTALSDLSSDI